MLLILKRCLYTTTVAVLLTLVALYAAARYRVEGEYFHANGVTIHYVDEGDPLGTPVVLIHGYAANIDLNWRYPGVRDYFTERGYRVIAIDLRGHGLSDKPHARDRYGIAMVEDVVRLMDHVGLSRAHVVGYSMGGMITLKLLEKHPDRLITATVGGAGWFEKNTPFVKSLHALEDSLDNGHGYGPLLRVLHPDSPLPKVQDYVTSYGMNFINDETAMRAMLPGMLDWFVSEAALHSNEVPLLVICGTDDPLNVGARNIDGVASHTEVVYIDGGDHSSTVMKAAFRERIREHVAAHTAPEEIESAPTRTLAVR